MIRFGKYPSEAASAQTMIGYLNDRNHGPRILLVGVTFRDAAGTVTHSEFWNAINKNQDGTDVTLSDGRLARNVIRHWAGHADHFHWRIRLE